MTYAVIDTETSGLNANEHAILQLGCIFTTDDFEILEEYVTLVNPAETCIIDQRALDINKLDMEVIKKTAPSERHVINKLNELLVKHNGSTFLGFNLFFDLQFLRSVAYRNRMHIRSVGLAMDLAMAVAEIDDVKKYSLKSTLEHYGIPANPKAHDALADCHSTLEIARMVMK